MDVMEVDDVPLGLRDMLGRAGYPGLAAELDRARAPWHMYVARVDDVVGFLEGCFDFQHEQRHAQAGHPAPWAFVSNIVVDPAFRGRGVGSALIKRFVVDAAGAGCTYVALEVNLRDREGLETRMEFFRGRGFTALSTKPGRPDLPELMGAPVAVVSA
jgi:GNAT superfamily N-acetyltransferase